MYCVPVGTCVSSVVPCFFMCSFQISVLFVRMRVEFSLFNSGILGSCDVFLLVKFVCAILLRIGCGRSLYVWCFLVLCICWLW